MPAALPPVSIDLPRTGHGGGDIHPPFRGGDDGGRGGDGAFNYGQRLRRARLAMFLAMGSIFMLFVCFTTAYLARQSSPELDPVTGNYVRTWTPLDLPLTLLFINTGLILASSISVELARRRITREAALAPIRSIPGITVDDGRRFPWLALRITLGVAFLCGQLLAWRELAHRGFYLSTTASSSFFYLLTATHAIHLTGGVVVLMYAAATTSIFRRPIGKRRIVVDVTAWYWHFMAFIWIYIFALLWLAK
jgi:cytochrome c oxidase subunit III